MTQPQISDAKELAKRFAQHGRQLAQEREEMIRSAAKRHATAGSPPKTDSVAGTKAAIRIYLQEYDLWKHRMKREQEDAPDSSAKAADGKAEGCSNG